MNPTEALTTACDLAAVQVEAAANTPGAQTACADFNAQQLVSHMVAALEFNTALVSGEASDANPFDSAQLPEAEMVSRYKAAADALIAAATSASPDTMVNHPASPEPMPLAAALKFPTFDMYVHSWDLSRATGVEGEYPQDLHAEVSAWCHQVFAGERTPGVVNGAVPAPANATDIQELAAFLGRPC
jgi:uncharacterized protein (TIGR03086 family)